MMPPFMKLSVREKKVLLLCIAGALLFTGLESWYPFDLFFQRPFFSDSGWLIPKALHKEIKAWAYTLPKVLLAICCVLSLATGTVFSLKARPKGRCAAWARPLLIVGLSIALVPATIAAIKAVTGGYSPVDLIEFGGGKPFSGFFVQIWGGAGFSEGRSFPAGHASGGFALMALWYLPVRGVLRGLGLLAGILAGWGMGIYQLARGEHFLSHTLVCMFIAGALVLIIAGAVRALPGRAAGSNAAL